MTRIFTHCVLLLACIGCSKSQHEFALGRPGFAQMLSISNLVGEVIVEERTADGAMKKITSATLQQKGDAYTVEIGELPAGVELYFSIVWKSDGIVIAVSAKPSTVQIKRGENTSLGFPQDSYIYPDDDSDGAANIFEVVWMADNPVTARHAHADDTLAPPGYFTGIARSIALPGEPTGVAARGLGSEVAVTSLRFSDDSGDITQVDHKVSLINLKNRSRTSVDLNCDQGEWAMEVRVNHGISDTFLAASCSNRVFFIRKNAEVLEITKSTVLPTLAYLAYSLSGDKLYAMHESGTITVLGAHPAHLDHGQIVTTLDRDKLGGTITPVDLVDTGNRLIIVDYLHNALVVVSHSEDSDYNYVGTAVEGRLSGPTGIALHPNKRRVYVANKENGTMSVVDIADPDPQEWRIVTSTEVAALASSVAIDQNYGSYVYVAGNNDVVALDTLTNRVLWKVQLGNADEAYPLVWGLSMHPAGESMAAAVADNSALLVFERPQIVNTEREPNQSLDAVTNTVGPMPSTVSGWIDNREQGVITFESTVETTVSGMTTFTEDIEDIWKLDPSGADSAILVAVTPTSGWARLSLSLLDSTGQVVDKAVFPSGAGQLSAATGVFLITPAISDLLGQSYLGVGALEGFVANHNYSSYDIVARPIQLPIPETNEVEPNNGIADAQYLLELPTQILGNVEADDIGELDVEEGEDIEDCYQLRPFRGWWAAKLETSQEDLDPHMLVFDDQGTRIFGQYGLASAGTTEYFIFEPRLDHADSSLKYLCVAIDDDASVNEGPYTLTIVDLE